MVTEMRNEQFLQTAENLKPKLFTNETVLNCSECVMRKGDSTVYDFGDHYVGYLSLDITPAGRLPDAPLFLQVQFFENKEEMKSNPKAYHGWISASWIQQEHIHIDDIPSVHQMERRYAFRYVRITVLRQSGNFPVRLNRLILHSESSADDATLIPYAGNEADAHMDRVAVRTLHECMQDVFEDGPKRDRRLWLGDLRLQAMTNYVTYRDFALVKRCLYLFAADTMDDGLVACNLFVRPQIKRDEQTMFDYALFFINTLWDYYKASGDIETLRELEPTAFRQYEILKEAFDGRDILNMKKVQGCFIDWSGFLEKQAAAQAVFVYALRDLIKIENALGKPCSELETQVKLKTDAARRRWYRERKDLYVGGDFGTYSYATQIWMVLSGIATAEEGKRMLQKIKRTPFAVKPSTPYLYHHYIQALINCGERELAYQEMNAYWGGMLERGADTFWELYNPSNPNESPYGGKIIHSYCHAWSCTPAYFLRTYFTEKGN